MKTREYRSRKKSRRAEQVRIRRTAVGASVVLLAVLLFLVFHNMRSGTADSYTADPNTLNAGASTAEEALKPDFTVELLTVNDYSRPGISSGTIHNIVIHYTANPGSTAQENRDYFEGLKDSHTTMASSHFIIGLGGEVIQCVPTSEIAYASNDRNYDTVSIECCHPDETGKFTNDTYRSMVRTTAWLCSKFGLTGKDVIRHYDITGKICPKYFVEHADAWDTFKSDVDDMLRLGSEAVQ